MCVFVDHGLHAQGEGEQVEDTFRNHFHMNLIHVKAEDRFLDALAGVTDPEEKRKIIGETFIRVFEEVQPRSRVRTTSSRGRSTRMSSSQAPRMQRRSRAITTLVACPTT